MDCAQGRGLEHEWDFRLNPRCVRCGVFRFDTLAERVFDAPRTTDHNPYHPLSEEEAEQRGREQKRYDAEQEPSKPIPGVCNSRTRCSHLHCARAATDMARADAVTYRAQAVALGKRAEDADVLEDRLEKLAESVGSEPGDVFDAVQFALDQGEADRLDLRQRIADLEDEVDTTHPQRALLKLKIRATYGVLLLAGAVGVMGTIKLGLLLF